MLPPGSMIRLLINCHCFNRKGIKFEKIETNFTEEKQILMKSARVFMDICLTLAEQLPNSGTERTEGQSARRTEDLCHRVEFLWLFKCFRN